MTLRKFALISGEDVFTIFSVDDDIAVNAVGPRLASGLSSNPTVLEIPLESEVTVGWTFDGTEYHNPA
jgi:hypothetical protein